MYFIFIHLELITDMLYSTLLLHYNIFYTLRNILKQKFMNNVYLYFIEVLK